MQVRVREATEKEYAAAQYRRVEGEAAEAVDSERVLLLPPCVVSYEGYVPLARAIFSLAQKSVNNSAVCITIRAWEDARYKLLSLIGSKKVTLTGRRHGVGDNKPLPVELLANMRVIDWMYDPFEKPLLRRRHPNAPLPDTAFFQCCYCPDDDMWQDGTCDQYFSSVHLSPEWTHLQVDVAEVAAAQLVPTGAVVSTTDRAKDASATPPLSVAETANGQRCQPQTVGITGLDGTPEINVPRSSNKSKFECGSWLYEEMMRSPQQRTMTQDEAYERAVKLWPGLSRRSLSSAWTNAVGKSGSNWSVGGRPSKSPHS